ncbi:succinyldiaminopimelate transaminase [Boudabousia tangfeifanii]|uniref:succinyldiaminopimelate transaminase n=1 Tax=Boudabousia tangfeifanii TaxID=1912795 RepID=UPI000A66BF09|nr:succinyldiaminopimelate transaminase [Boudabousia tangfeifanii]
MNLDTFKLPSFPWDSLTPYKELAAKHPQGLVNLSVGSPVDDTPKSVQQALIGAANSPSYPTVVGTSQLQNAIRKHLGSRGLKFAEGDLVLPTIGSKEAVALLPWQLGVEPGDTVLIPNCAYPTYEISALLAHARVVPVDPDPATWPDADFVWINYPANPHGEVASVARLREIVSWAREHDAVVASDECYAQLNWAGEESTPSLLSEEVIAGDNHNLLVLYSLSKQSNFAGYRGAFVAGDQRLIRALIELRKHSGFIVPAPVQAAMVEALEDEKSMLAQKEKYRSRREALISAVEAAGLENDPNATAGLYLWLRTPANAQKTLTSWELVGALAERGILVAPADFYQANPSGHVRMALTACDEQIAQACERLKASPII